MKSTFEPIRHEKDDLDDNVEQFVIMARLLSDLADRGIPCILFRYCIGCKGRRVTLSQYSWFNCLAMRRMSTVRLKCRSVDGFSRGAGTASERMKGLRV